MSYNVLDRLQNAPGTLAYPGQPGFGDGQQRRGKRIALGLGLVGGGLAVGTVWFGITTSPNGVHPRIEPIGFAVAALLVLFGVVRIIGSSGQDRKNQKRYYKLGGVPALDERQRAALQLDAWCAHSERGWIETLEGEPCQRRFRAAGVPVPTFHEFGPVPAPDDFLRGLDEDWGFVSADGYRSTMAKLFDGLHSLPFLGMLQAVEAEQDGAHDYLERLAGLVETDRATVLAAGQPRGDRPPSLVWGFDLWRVVRVSRVAWMAGLIDEQEAWHNMLRASQWVHALFASLDEYHQSLRLGHAFWSSDLTDVRGRAADIRTLRDEPRWPILDIPWGISDPVELPAHVRNGLVTADDAGADANPGTGGYL